MRFGLDDSVIDKLTKVFEANPKVDKAYIFGSRAKGNYRPDSDIDIAIKGYDISLDDILKMSVAFDDDGIINKIDLLDYNEIKEPALIEHIDRVGIEFYNRWKEYKLGDLIDVKHGFAFEGEFISSEPSINVLVTPGNFKIGGGFKDDKFKYYTGYVPDNYILNGGDIIVTMTDLSQDTDTLGFSAKVPNANGISFLHNQRIGLVEFLSEDADPEFIYWLMRDKNYQGFIVGSSSGTSIMHTSPGRIKEYEFLLPAKVEQNHIASILTSLDNKIDLLHRQNKTLEQLAETLFRQWFVEEAEEDWETATVANFADINKNTIQKHYPFTEIEYLDTGSITNSIITEYQTYKLVDAPSRAQRIIKDDDIVYSLVRPSQRHYGFLHSVKPNAVASTGFCVITSKSVNPYFLYLLLTRDETVEYLDMIAEASTSAYPSLKPSDIANFVFLKPPLKKLEEFSNFAANTWNKIKSNQTQIQSLTKMRDTLLPKLMSGEVRVKME